MPYDPIINVALRGRAWIEMAILDDVCVKMGVALRYGDRGDRRFDISRPPREGVALRFSVSMNSKPKSVALRSDNL